MTRISHAINFKSVFFTQNSFCVKFFFIIWTRNSSSKGYDCIISMPFKVTDIFIIFHAFKKKSTKLSMASYF